MKESTGADDPAWRKPTMFRNRTNFLTAVASLLLVGSALTINSCAGSTGHSHPEVEVALAETENINIYGEYSGRIQPQQFVEVRARVDGYLQKVLFDEGAYVTKGQTLFVIDPEIYIARVNRAEAQLKKAQAQAQKASRDLKRIRPLYEQNAASQLDLDNVDAAYESALADVAVCEVDLNLAEMTLGYTTVKAPISGYVSPDNVDVGALVGPGAKSLLATVVKSDTVRIDFTMTTLEYMRAKSCMETADTTQLCKPDTTVTIMMADGGAYPHRGVVDFSNPQIDHKTGTISVRAEMPNPSYVLIPGQQIRVRMLTDVRKNEVLIPTSAVVADDDEHYVFVIGADNVVEKRLVSVGPEVGDKSVIESGVRADEMVVIDGNSDLSAGMKVSPVVASGNIK